MGLPVLFRGSGVAAQNIVDAGGIVSAEALGQPDVVAVVESAAVASAGAFGALAVGADIGAAGIASEEAFGSGAINADISASGVATGETSGAPTVGAQVGDAGALGSDSIFGLLGLDLSVIGLSIAGAEDFGLPSVTVPTLHPFDLRRFMEVGLGVPLKRVAWPKLESPLGRKKKRRRRKAPTISGEVVPSIATGAVIAHRRRAAIALLCE